LYFFKKKPDGHPLPTSRQLSFFLLKMICEQGWTWRKRTVDCFRDRASWRDSEQW